MKIRTKLLALATTAIVAGVAFHAIAAPPEGGAMPFMNHAGPHGMIGMAAMGHGVADPAAHLASLKTELGITAAQAPAWDAYAKAMQDTASAMQASHPGMDMGAMHAMSDPDRQAAMSAMRTQHQTAFAGVTVAAETLLAALDDSQKAKARDLLPGLAARGHAMMGPGGMGGPAMMGRGMPQVH